MLRQILAGVVLGTGGLCAPAADPTPPQPSVVMFWEWEIGVLDVSPPTRLDILMNYSDPAQDDDLAAEIERCEAMAGELISNPTGTIYICEGVDY